jgi:hypothetical protein
MVEIIQKIQENTNLDKKTIHIHGRMEHNLARYAKYYSCGHTKILEVVYSQGKLITMEEIFCGHW